MITILVISILAALAFVFFLYRKRGDLYSKKRIHTTLEYQHFPSVNQEEKQLRDRNYNRIVTKKREIPRKTYLSGRLQGKYWGELVGDKDAIQQHTALYDFHIYEADVYIESSKVCTCIDSSKSECSGLHTEVEGKFNLGDASAFPREKLPQLLPVIVKKEGKEYAINIHEPQLANIRFISRLHQTEGEEVFGTIEADITGFLLDFIIEEYSTLEYSDNIDTTNGLSVNHAIPQFRREKIPAAIYYQPSRTYQRYSPAASGGGLVSSVVGILAIAVWAAFLITLLPQMAIILPFIAIPLLFRLIPPMVWQWIVKVIGAIMCIGFFVAIAGILKYHPIRHPVPLVKDNPKADIPDRTQVNDTVITHHLQWKNYEGQDYRGEISVRRSALQSATQFKLSLKAPDNTAQSYDELLYHLKEHDKNALPGVYRLFDSIRTAQHLQADKFAELIVSFVQDIPYTVVLPEGCSASLYADPFIRKYLATPGARCDGYEKFGINTPIEFMASLNGDCDTRTLLIYTILSHYKYDVALFSSEYYNHSLIGINLPYNGAAFVYYSKRYILWETTATGIKPGVLPYEISNLNYWRISLKST